MANNPEECVGTPLPMEHCVWSENSITFKKLEKKMYNSTIPHKRLPCKQCIIRGAELLHTLNYLDMAESKENEMESSPPFGDSVEAFSATGIE